jgi:quinol monooxygenase YgiN
MIHVVAVLTTKPGMRAEVLKHFLANVPNVHAEKGCIEYGAAVDEGGAPSWAAKHGPDAIVVIEKWESVDALNAHAAAPHMKAYAAKVKDMLAGRAVYVLTPC